MTNEVIDKTILLIKDELEKKNKESSFELFTDIKVIMAGIRLLKFKIGSISIDISINNFSGLFKILFINKKLIRYNHMRRINISAVPLILPKNRPLKVLSLQKPIRLPSIYRFATSARFS